MERKVNGYGLNMLPCYLELSQGQLLESNEQLKNLEACKNRPYVLDDALVDHIIRLHMDQNESNGILMEQCKKWRCQNPNEAQLSDIQKVEQAALALEKVNHQILFLAKHFKDHTIDRILEKEDGELALEFLKGNLYPPTES